MLFYEGGECCGQEAQEEEREQIVFRNSKERRIPMAEKSEKSKKKAKKKRRTRKKVGKK